MIRKKEELLREEKSNLRGGRGNIEIAHLIQGEELKKNASLFSVITIPRDASIGEHSHDEDYEVYYILKGKGLVTENNAKTEVNEGDVVYTSNGETHAIENIGITDLVMLAVVIYE